MLIHNTAGDGYGGVVGLLQALVVLGYVQALVMLGEVVSNFSCCWCLVAWWQPRKGLAKGKLG